MGGSEDGFLANGVIRAAAVASIYPICCLLCLSERRRLFLRVCENTVNQRQLITEHIDQGISASYRTENEYTSLAKKSQHWEAAQSTTKTV